MMFCEGNKHIADGGREIVRQLKYAFKAQWRCWRDKKCARAYRRNRHSRFPLEARRCRWCNWQLLLFARRNWFRGDYWFAVDFARKTKNIIMREFSDVFARCRCLMFHLATESAFLHSNTYISVWLEAPKAITHFLIIASLAGGRNNVKNLVYECFLRRAEVYPFSHFECGRQIAANRLDGVLRSEFLEICAKTFSVHYSRPEIENMFYNIHAERKGNKRKRWQKCFACSSPFISFCKRRSENKTK